MATVSTLYYTPQSVTITLASLADSTWRESSYIDNASDKYIDALLGGLIKVSSSSPITVGGTVDIYAYASWNASNYTAGCSGSDAAYTASGEEGLLRHVETIIVDATLSEVYNFGPVSMAGVFGGTLPSRWGLVAYNGTGQSLFASGHSIQYTGVKFDSA